MQSLENWSEFVKGNELFVSEFPIRNFESGELVIYSFKQENITSSWGLKKNKNWQYCFKKHLKGSSVKF